MAKRTRKICKSEAKLQEFVVVAFAENMEQAQEYESLLKNNEIPVVINEQHKQSKDGKDIAVMVPEDFLDEAHVVIESQDTYEDFYDFALEDEGDDDLDDDIFDDNF